MFLLVAVLSYSRRLFVKALLNERGDDWREGVVAEFRHFGGVPRARLGDNARAPAGAAIGRPAPSAFIPPIAPFAARWQDSVVSWPTARQSSRAVAMSAAYMPASSSS